MTTFARFAWTQGRRVLLRWVVVQHSLLALTFWTAFIGGSALLIANGIGWVRYVLLAIWLVLAAPGLVFQLQCLTDVLSCALTGRSYFYPALRQEMERRATAENRPNPLSGVGRFLYWMGMTSPLAGLGVWALIVLVRMPRSAHEPVPEKPLSRSELRAALRLDRKFQDVVVGEVPPAPTDPRPPDRLRWGRNLYLARNYGFSGRIRNDQCMGAGSG